MRVLSPALLTGLRIWHCQELWYRSQTWLGSHIAVAVAVARQLQLQFGLGTATCHRCGPKNRKKKKKDRKVSYNPFPFESQMSANDQALMTYPFNQEHVLFKGDLSIYSPALFSNFNFFLIKKVNKVIHILLFQIKQQHVVKGTLGERLRGKQTWDNLQGSLPAFADELQEDAHCIMSC